jgi:heptosyltransferase-2
MKILVVKIAAIGDVVMSLPMLTYLRDQYPKAHVTWVCGKQVAPLLHATHLIDRIIEIDERKLLTGNLFTRLIALGQIWRKVAGRYDLCITAHADPRYRLISLPIRCSSRRFFNRKGKRMHPIPGRYHAEEYVRLLSGNDGPSSPALKFPTLSFTATSSPPFRDFIVLAPGGAKNILADDALRRWPIESYVHLIKSLADLPFEMIIIGSESDGWIQPYLKNLTCTDRIGKLDLLETVNLLSHCKLLITHDSGPLHLAKLANCPTIALFGPTNPSEKVGPKENIKVLWGGESLACRPCYDGKTYAPCRQNKCLLSLKPEQVFEEIKRLLNLANYLCTH